jgi:hypothetical protein
MMLRALGGLGFRELIAKLHHYQIFARFDVTFAVTISS